MYFSWPAHPTPHCPVALRTPVSWSLPERPSWRKGREELGVVQGYIVERRALSLRLLFLFFSSPTQSLTLKAPPLDPWAHTSQNYLKSGPIPRHLYQPKHHIFKSQHHKPHTSSCLSTLLLFYGKSYIILLTQRQKPQSYITTTYTNSPHRLQPKKKNPTDNHNSLDS